MTGNSAAVPTVSPEPRGGVRARVVGELDVAAALRLEPLLDRYAARADALVLDFSGVTFCGSSGVNLLVLRLRRRCRGSGTRLRVDAVARQPARVFRLLGVDTAVPCAFV